MKSFQMLTHKVVRLHLHFQNGLWTLCITCSLYVTVWVITSAQIQLKNTSTGFLFPLWRHVKQNQCPQHNLAQKSTMIDKNADLAFPLWLQCLCVLVRFISSPRQSCQSTLSGTAGTPPLWTKTPAPWPSWQVGPGDSWTVSLNCGWGSKWDRQQVNTGWWTHLNIETIERTGSKCQVKGKKKQIIHKWIITNWHSFQDLISKKLRFPLEILL